MNEEITNAVENQDDAEIEIYTDSTLNELANENGENDASVVGVVSGLVLTVSVIVAGFVATKKLVKYFGDRIEEKRAKKKAEEIEDSEDDDDDDDDNSEE